MPRHDPHKLLTTLKLACEGQESATVTWAAQSLCAMSIGIGSDTLEIAKARAIAAGEVIAEQVERNWPKITAERRRG